MTGSDDPRVELRRAFEQAALVVKGVSPGQLGQPTPCSEFDVGALLAHLLGVGNRIGGIGRGEAQAGEVATETGIASDEWGDAFDRAMEAALQAWSDDSLLERELVLPFGTFPGPLVARIYMLELVAHAWDLAAATGQVPILDPDLAELALPIAEAMLPPQPRGGEMPFGPVVEVPQGRPPYDRLAGYLGRRPA